MAGIVVGATLTITPGPAVAEDPGGPEWASREAPHEVPRAVPPAVTAPVTRQVTPSVTRIAVGGFTQPGPGVALAEGVPPGVPLTEAAPARAVAVARTLRLARVSTARFSAVGVTWDAVRGALGEVSVAVRGHAPGGDWGAWQAVGPAEDDDADFPSGRQARGAADLVWLGRSDGVELVITVLRGPSPTGVVADLIDPQEAPGDAVALDPEATSPRRSVPRPEAADPLAGRAATPGAGRVPMPPVFRRGSWGAPEWQPNWRPTYAPVVKAVAWHHTATTNSYAAGDVPGMLRSIYQFHTGSRGWSDIGYPAVVDRFGRLWEGRSGGLSKAVVGAHSGGYNTGTSGVAVLGDHRSVPVPPAATEAAAKFMAWKFSLGPAVDPRGTVSLTGGGSTSRYPAGTTISVFRVFPHRTTNPTECPGARGVEVLGTLRSRAFQLLGDWGNGGTVRARLATWRPSDARLRVLGVAAPVWTGTLGDLPVPADYDGDGVSDAATWSPTTGVWSVSSSVDGTIRQTQWGYPGDRPVPADFDGNGRAELTVWRPATGEWWVHGAATVVYGEPGDIPLPADYDGDGRDDRTVWRPSTGTWFMQGVGVTAVGESWHLPVPADYNGDGAAEPATWSPVTYRWYVKGRSPVRFGDRGDIPVPGQYDGDGRADRAVFHIHPVGNPSQAPATWRIDGIGSYDTGAAGDIPMPLR